jgi:hypothetical protein
MGAAERQMMDDKLRARIERVAVADLCHCQGLRGRYVYEMGALVHSGRG